MAEPMPFDSPMIAAITSVAAVGVALSLGALAVDGWSSAVGVAIGGLAATANLWMFAHIGRNVLAGGRKKRIWGLLGALKLIALFGGLYWLMSEGIVSGLALAIGYTSLPIGIALAAIVGPRPGDDDEAAGHGGADLLNAGPTMAKPSGFAPRGTAPRRDRG